MKRYLILCIITLMLVTSANGLALDFQNPSDFSAHVMCIGTDQTAQWVHNTSGGNSLVEGCFFGSQTPLLMTYSAITSDCNSGYVFAVDSTITQMGSTVYYTGLTQPVRVEAKMEGGYFNVYVDGVYEGTGGVLPRNPSYIAWWATCGAPYGVDDIVWGSTESKYVFGMPESGYFIMKDILNPAASGFYRVNQTVANGSPTLINSYRFPSTYSKSNGDNKSVDFESPTGGKQLHYYTGTGWTGQIYWNLTEFFNENPSYGLYRTLIDNQSDSPGFATSDWIPYIGSGATIQWDKQSYAVGETALLSVEISDSYYSTEFYHYHVVIMDASGSEVTDADIVITDSSPYTGEVEYTWTDDNDEGVYYGLIYATELSDDEEILLNYATADLNSNVIINGYVFDATNETVISGVTVNVTQGITTNSLTTASDGNYSTTSLFSENTPTTIDAIMSGYETYQHVFTPLRSGSIQINLTLMPTIPEHSGIALGGIVRTSPYNRTVNSAAVTIKNGTTEYIVTTNSVGYYIRNDMPNGSIWDIWGSKSGFSNSSIYQKLVFGS